MSTRRANPPRTPRGDSLPNRLFRRVSPRGPQTAHAHRDIIGEPADVEGGPDDRAITVLVPNDGFRQRLTRHYAGVIKEAADEVGRPGTTISLITDDSAPRAA